MQTASTQIEELLIPVTSTTPLAGFAELYELHSEAVFRAALRVTGNPADAEDVVQTVFLRIMSRGARGGDVEDVAQPAALGSSRSGRAGARMRRSLRSTACSSPCRLPSRCRSLR